MSELDMTLAINHRYPLSSGTDRAILDELVATRGYDRKYDILQLNPIHPRHHVVDRSP